MVFDTEKIRKILGLDREDVSTPTIQNPSGPGVRREGPATTPTENETGLTPEFTQFAEEFIQTTTEPGGDVTDSSSSCADTAQAEATDEAALEEEFNLGEFLPGSGGITAATDPSSCEPGEKTDEDCETPVDSTNVPTPETGAEPDATTPEGSNETSPTAARSTIETRASTTTVITPSSTYNKRFATLTDDGKNAASELRRAGVSEEALNQIIGRGDPAEASKRLRDLFNSTRNTFLSQAYPLVNGLSNRLKKYNSECEEFQRVLVQGGAGLNARRLSCGDYRQSIGFQTILRDNIRVQYGSGNPAVTDLTNKINRANSGLEVKSIRSEYTDEFPRGRQRNSANGRAPVLINRFVRADLQNR